MWSFLKRLFPCKHDFRTKGDLVEVGVTLGWDLRPTIDFDRKATCAKCGKVRIDGVVVFGHRRLWPERYDDTGWPITKDGKRMVIRG